MARPSAREPDCADCVPLEVARNRGTGLSWRGSADATPLSNPEAGRWNELPSVGSGAGLFSRLAYVGLDGKIDALRLTRQYNLQYLVMVDMAGNDSAAGTLYSLAYDDIYFAALGRSLQDDGLYSIAETPYSSPAVRAYGGLLGYAAGPVNLNIAYQRKSSLIDANVIALDTSVRNTLVAANLHLGVATAYAAFGQNKGEGSSPWDPSNPYGALAVSSTSNDSRDLLLGLSIPLRGFAVNASYIRKDDRTVLNHDVNKIALGMTYSVAQRFDLYLLGASVKNKNGAVYGLGNAEATGRSERALSVGLRRSF